ncbi:unnamed protein product [Medioppia subpectinata]|uniref:Uncharacterized protein n=1 Tax=Medioppia subpectinata TaxID=1979941 RepID=A0A7R9PY69_9ACAR|nr:unnamed protein product [Medioppia subpectinata]CAG2105569.1 unnamed protein product [Medioppia subpectinata]
MDSRLAFNGTVDEIILGPDYMKRVWIPDTFIPNSRQMTPQMSISSEPNIFVKVYNNGTVFLSIYASILALCPMDLTNFPMDSQLCLLEIESYGQNNADIEYRWSTKEGYDGFILVRSDIMYAFALKRSLVYYLNQVYIPAFLIVVISWIPFWMDRKDNHARVALGVTTVLTITTLVTNTSATLPKISYMKSIDIYLGFCYAMVFAALLEYAVVGYREISSSDVAVVVVSGGKMRANTRSVGPNRTNTIDRHSRWIFPLVNIIFNLIYWFTYLSISTQPVDPNKRINAL